jgi:hypothetical protein
MSGVELLECATKCGNAHTTSRGVPLEVLPQRRDRCEAPASRVFTCDLERFAVELVRESQQGRLDASGGESVDHADHQRPRLAEASSHAHRSAARSRCSDDGRTATIRYVWGSIRSTTPSRARRTNWFAVTPSAFAASMRNTPHECSLSLQSAATGVHRTLGV